MSDITSTTNLTPSFFLSREQLFAVERAVDFFREGKKPSLTLGGFAGTGKTTVIKEIKHRLDDLRLDVGFSAFTGKACSVLRKKGVPAETMHSTMYKPAGIDKVTKQPIWTKISELPFDVAIIDEASMLGGELHRDWMSFGVPTLFVGDPGQLEPVSPDDPNLMKNPDLLLQEIHRQGAGNPIIDYSLLARTGKQESWGRGETKQTDQGRVRILPKPKELQALLASINEDTVNSVDQIIVPTNKLRTEINKRVRSLLARDALVCVGDRVICLENNSAFGVFNGQQFVVKDVDEWDNSPNVKLELQEEGTNYTVRVPCLQSVFEGTFVKTPTKDGQPATRYNKRFSCLFDYGYAITCHKSQGSEWDRVLVIEQWMPPKVWDHKRWAYTAITRAAKELYYAR